MAIDLYHIAGSPPCNAVQLAANAVGVKLNLKTTDLEKGEHLTPKFIALNPQHCLPTIVDGSLSLWESRAIIIYLAKKYDKSGKWYPSCPTKQAIINQRLYFDSTLYQRFADYYFAVLLERQPAIPDRLKKLEDTVRFLDTFLKEWTWFAGNEPTIADIALLATISVFEAVHFNFTSYPNVLRWYCKAKVTLPGSTIRDANVGEFKQFIYQQLIRHKL